MPTNYFEPRKSSEIKTVDREQLVKNIRIYADSESSSDQSWGTTLNLMADLVASSIESEITPIQYLALEREAIRLSRKELADLEKERMLLEKPTIESSLRALLSGLTILSPVGRKNDTSELAKLATLRSSLFEEDFCILLQEETTKSLPLVDVTSLNPQTLRAVVTNLEQASEIAEWFYLNLTKALLEKGNLFITNSGFKLKDNSSISQELIAPNNPYSLSFIRWERHSMPFTVTPNGGLGIHIWDASTHFEVSIITPLGPINICSEKTYLFDRKALNDVISRAKNVFGLREIEVEARRAMHDSSDKIYAVTTNLNGDKLAPFIESTPPTSVIADGILGLTRDSICPKLRFEQLDIPLSDQLHAHEMEAMRRRKFSELYELANRIYRDLKITNGIACIQTSEQSTTTQDDLKTFVENFEQYEMSFGPEKDSYFRLSLNSIEVALAARDNNLEKARTIAAGCRLDRMPNIGDLAGSEISLGKIFEKNSLYNESDPLLLFGLEHYFTSQHKYPFFISKEGVEQNQENIKILERLVERVGELHPLYPALQRVLEAKHGADLTNQISHLNKQMSELPNALTKRPFFGSFSRGLLSTATSTNREYSEHEYLLLTQAYETERLRAEIGLPALSSSIDLMEQLAYLYYQNERYKEADEVLKFAYQRQDVADREWIKTYNIKDSSQEWFRTHGNKSKILTDLSANCLKWGKPVTAAVYIDEAARLFFPQVEDRTANCIELNALRVTAYSKASMFDRAADIVLENLDLKSRHGVHETKGQILSQRLMAALYRNISAAKAGEVKEKDLVIIDDLIDQLSERPLWNAEMMLPLKMQIIAIMAVGGREREVLKKCDVLFKELDEVSDQYKPLLFSLRFLRGVLRAEAGYEAAALEDFKDIFSTINDAPSESELLVSALLLSNAPESLTEEGAGIDSLNTHLFERRLIALSNSLAQREGSSTERMLLLKGLATLQAHMGKMRASAQNRAEAEEVAIEQLLDSATEMAARMQ